MKSFLFVKFSPLHKDKYIDSHKWENKSIGIELDTIIKTSKGTWFKISPTWKFFQFKNNRKATQFNFVKACDIKIIETKDEKNYGTIIKDKNTFPIIDCIMTAAKCIFSFL